MAKHTDVTFIRKKGKIIPIRKRKGAQEKKKKRKLTAKDLDLRKKETRSKLSFKKDIAPVFKKFGRQRKPKEKRRLTAGLTIAGATVGGAIGAGVAFTKSLFNKKSKAGLIGAGAGALLGLVGGITDKTKVVSKRKLNREIKRNLARRLKLEGSSV